MAGAILKKLSLKSWRALYGLAFGGVLSFAVVAGFMNGGTVMRSALGELVSYFILIHLGIIAVFSAVERVLPVCRSGVQPDCLPVRSCIASITVGCRCTLIEITRQCFLYGTFSLARTITRKPTSIRPLACMMRRRWRVSWRRCCCRSRDGHRCTAGGDRQRLEWVVQ
jgi:hypothetical protein